MRLSSLIRVRDLARALNRPAAAYRQADNVAYGEHRRQVLDVYAPKEVANAPVVIFFHGGSWRSGDKLSCAFIAGAMAQRGYVVVTPNYRLYPEVRFPAFMEDAAAAVAWASKHITEYGGDSQKIVLMGHSAGAHIAALLSYDDQYLKRAGLSPTSIRAFIGLSGAYDFYPRPDLRPIFDLNDPAEPWKPIRRITATATPALLATGSLDFIVAPGNSRRYALALRARGVSVELKVYPWIEHMGIILAIARRWHWLAPVLIDITAFLDDALA